MFEEDFIELRAAVTEEKQTRRFNRTVCNIGEDCADANSFHKKSLLKEQSICIESADKLPSKAHMK